jgi:hypothetical protein
MLSFKAAKRFGWIRKRVPVLAVLAVGLAGSVATVNAANADTNGAGVAADEAQAGDVSAQYNQSTRRVWDLPGGSSNPEAAAFLRVTDNHRKFMEICDHLYDGSGLGIQLDPSGPQNPITYWDKGAGDQGCDTYTVHYSVRKWRWVSVHENGTVRDVLDWAIWPLPHADY